jgi:hypothetical protein
VRCARCGKDNPAEVHTCTAPPAIYLAEQIEATYYQPTLPRRAAAELRRLHEANEALREVLKRCREMVGHPDNIDRKSVV